MNMNIETLVYNELLKLITGPEKIYSDLDLYEEFVAEHGYEPSWNEFHLVINGMEAGGQCLAGEIGRHLQRQMGVSNPSDVILFFADSIIRACEECDEELSEEDIRACVLFNVAHERRHSYQPLSLVLEKGGMADDIKLYDALPHEADANNFALDVLQGKATLEDVATWPINTSCNWTH